MVKVARKPKGSKDCEVCIVNVRKRWLALLGSIIALASSFLTNYINDQSMKVDGSVTIGGR